MTRNCYVLDSSVWIDAWRGYPPDIPVFAPIWNGIDALIGRKVLVSPEDVKEELERGADALIKYLKQRSGLFYPLDAELQASLIDVVAQYELADPNSDKNRADPIVVALGRVKKATVVSNEHPSKTLGKGGRPRIPDACAGLGIRCIKWLEFLKEEPWNS
jgi:hypothetical protein